MILEVKDINTYYGTSHILFDVSLQVDKGRIVALLGRNGAGKTTTLRSIMGLTPPHNGSVKFQGKEIKGKPAYVIAQQGLGFVPDDRGIFGTLTVKQNLEVVARKGNRGLEWTLETVYELFPVLRKLESRKGGQLSGGEQQMLTVARTLMTNPQMLLLDEPVEGLSPLVVKTLAEKITEVKAKGLSILLSEQNVKFAIELSDRAYVIDKGAIRFQGAIDELRENEEVKKRYLMI
jgi:branched-chain amino acid transport system ATP-binding protein